LRKEALDHTLCRTCCGRIYGPVTRLTTYWMNTVLPSIISNAMGFPRSSI
jgi:hypothetical protein